jgi:DNA-binding Lrp family transcriptional regulator
MTKNEQTSYIFAKCKGERAHTISQIQRIPNVESATPVTGRFDLVIKLRTNEPAKAFTTMEKVRSIPSITNTQTTISFESIINSSNRADSESPLAFALLKVRGSFDSILRKLRTIPNFAEAHVIPGAFDILAAFRADNSEDLLEKSVEKIGTINGITATRPSYHTTCQKSSDDSRPGPADSPETSFFLHTKAGQGPKRASEPGHLLVARRLACENLTRGNGLKNRPWSQ